MADVEDKAKAEKLAAARKALAQRKKKMAKKDGSKADEKTEAKSDNATAVEPTPEPTDAGPSEASTTEAISDQPASPTQTNVTPAHQSKLRSASFRKGSISGASGPLSPGQFSPEGETAPEIYRKHVARIEELEKENKKLAKDASDSEKRWKKAEEELAELGEADGDGPSKGANADAEKLKDEIASLRRQNAQLLQQVSKAGARHGASASISMSSTPGELESQLASKTSTIEAMELEMSKLRAQLEKVAAGSSSEREQIPALEARLARSEKAASLAQQELADVRKSLDRTVEKAVREGSERTSAETKLKSLEHDLAHQLGVRADLEKKVEALEKKVTTLTTLHKEHDARTQALRKEKEAAEKDAKMQRTRVETLEAENLKLKSRRSIEGGGGLDDEGLEELENEERSRLEKKVRDLEAEIHELRRGVWREKRRELEGETGHGFDDVDLSSNLSPSHRKPAAGFSDLITSGINALTGGTDDGGFLEDDDMDFDEDAFRKAHEEEAKKRIERIKDIKRALKNWEGWRLDIVENRRGGGEGIGELFEI